MAQQEAAQPGVPWRDRLAIIVETMRDTSRETDPQKMVRVYREKISRIVRVDGMISVTLRGVTPPDYRVARSSTWKDEVNPWEERDRLPVFRGGLVGELVHGAEPRILNDFRLAEDDPCRELFQGMRSLACIPVFDGGRVLNTMIFLRAHPQGFDGEQLPEMVWTVNLLGRATHNLALSVELARVNAQLDREMSAVAEIQHSLLPAELPRVADLDIAASYQTARQAGGDYYDFFDLADGRTGILIADVSGHGPHAAVVMGITHSLAHTYAGPPAPPSRLLSHLNEHLERLYASATGSFVTLFYGVYDPESRALVYASAGHNPPRLYRQGGEPLVLGRASAPPLGVVRESTYQDESETLRSGDVLVLYTDGITEARDREGRFFGTERLDAVFAQAATSAEACLARALGALDAFARGRAAHDDRTLVVLRLR